MLQVSPLAPSSLSSLLLIFYLFNLSTVFLFLPLLCPDQCLSLLLFALSVALEGPNKWHGLSQTTSQWGRGLFMAAGSHILWLDGYTGTENLLLFFLCTFMNFALLNSKVDTEVLAYDLRLWAWLEHRVSLVHDTPCRATDLIPCNIKPSSQSQKDLQPPFLFFESSSTWCSTSFLCVCSTGGH